MPSDFETVEKALDDWWGWLRDGDKHDLYEPAAVALSNIRSRLEREEHHCAALTTRLEQAEEWEERAVRSMDACCAVAGISPHDLVPAHIESRLREAEAENQALSENYDRNRGLWATQLMRYEEALKQADKQAQEAASDILDAGGLGSATKAARLVLDIRDIARQALSPEDVKR